MTPAEEQFVERFGRHFEADGVPRIGGRLYGYLLLQTEPRSLDELADALHVSKASISTNARLLVQWGLVERATRPGDRRDFYAAADDLAGVLQLRLQRVRAMTDLLGTGADAVPADRPDAAHRLTEMARFHAAAAELLEDLLERWFGPDAG
ncbi:MAG: GbsR/MarR family transcriptional regulator [Candidatus Longimicrobiales bacterium M2_2A_002]